MDHFFLSVAMIACGGIAPLFLCRRFALMKAAGVAAMGAGCLVGLVQAGSILFHARAYEVSFEYLNAFALAFKIDTLSAFFLVVIFAVSSMAALYSYHYMDDPQKALRTAAHYLAFSLLTAAMALVVAANNLITFLLAWEIMSLSSFFLVIYDYESAQNRRAGYLYFVFSHVGALFILAAFGVIHAHAGSLTFEAAAALPEAAKILVFVLALIGFGSKAGVFPFHIWLPHAHPAAPSHISAVMSGVMIKIGIYGIVRIYMLLNWHTALFGDIVLIAGMVSGILGVVYALGQRDLKRMLAYSSVENVGIILIGIGIGMIGVAAGKPIMAVLGFTGGLLHVLNHAIFKSLLFMGAGMVLHQTGTRSMDLLGGLIKKMPITGTTFLIGSLAISALPPFNGFASEFLIYMGGFNGVALSKTEFALSLLAIVSLAVIGGLALACFTRVMGVVFQGEPRSKAAVNVNEHGTLMLIPMVLLAGACILIGVFPTFFMTLAIKAAASLGLGYARIPLEPFTELTVNITRFALLVFALFAGILLLRTWLYRGKAVTRSGTWGCGFTQPTVKMQYTSSSYAASILEFFRPAAPLSEEHAPIQGCFPARTHYRSQVHDAAELQMHRLVVKPVTWLFDRLRWLQHGDIHLYIGYILLAIVVLLFFV
jgi:hydrogenase-4 component B